VIEFANRYLTPRTRRGSEREQIRPKFARLTALGYSQKTNGGEMRMGISDRVGRLFRRERKRDLSVPEKERTLVCENCRTPIPGNTNICPTCGMRPGPQSITDIMKRGGKS